MAGVGIAEGVQWGCAASAVAKGIQPVPRKKKRLPLPWWRNVAGVLPPRERGANRTKPLLPLSWRSAPSGSCWQTQLAKQNCGFRFQPQHHGAKCGRLPFISGIIRGPKEAGYWGTDGIKWLILRKIFYVMYTTDISIKQKQVLNNNSK